MGLHFKYGKKTIDNDNFRYVHIRVFYLFLSTLNFGQHNTTKNKVVDKIIFKESKSLRTYINHARYQAKIN